MLRTCCSRDAPICKKDDPSAWKGQKEAALYINDLQPELC